MATDDNQLGNFLKARRTRLDPASLGYPMTRRRTPGLRREEVAQRANVSATWYTWLEQGRGGSPSADVLDRLSRGLNLSDAEREHLFLLAQNRPPEVEYRKSEGATPQLQRVLDALEFSPAYVRSSDWKVVAWNRAATAVFGDFGEIPEERRNMLHIFFSEPEARSRIPHWDSVARGMVATFRAEAARTGARVKDFVEGLSLLFPEFRKLWEENDVGGCGEGVKIWEDPKVGSITLEYSTFAVEGSYDLNLVVFNPAKPADRTRVRYLMETTDARSGNSGE